MTWLKNILRGHKVPLGVAILATAAAVPTVVALNPLASSQAAGGETSSVPTLVGTLGLFKATRTSEDVLPGNLEAAASSLAANVNVANSRKALVTQQGASVYLVPTATGVCLLTSNLSVASCYSLEDVAHGAAAASDS
jgi:hypothetical protein